MILLETIENHPSVSTLPIIEGWIQKNGHCPTSSFNFTLTIDPTLEESRLLLPCPFFPPEIVE